MKDIPRQKLELTSISLKHYQVEVHQNGKSWMPRLRVILYGSVPYSPSSKGKKKNEYELAAELAVYRSISPCTRQAIWKGKQLTWSLRWSSTQTQLTKMLASRA